MPVYRLSDTYYGAQFEPDRNLLHNGAIQVAQRGTSSAGITASGYYTADRWNADIGTMGTWTQSVENDAPTGSGFRKSLKMLATTADASPAAGDYCMVQQRVEGQDIQRIKKGTSSAQQITLSFWVKSNATGTYIVEVYDIDNTRSVSASYSISASATWEQKSVTFPADATGAFDNDNLGSMQATFWLAAGTSFSSGTLATTWGAVTTANRAVGQTNLAATTNNYWQVTGVQLECGPAATPFEFKSYADDLWECQRYYQRVVAGGTYGRVGTALASSTTNVYISVPLPTQMRSTAIYSAISAIVASSGATSLTLTSPANSQPSYTMGHISATVTGATSGAFYEVTGNNDAAAYIAFTADL